MPYVDVRIIAGASRDQKAALVRRITSALVEILDKRPEHTHVVIQEVEEENWGFAGVLTDEFRSRTHASESIEEITRS